jgi:tetratricopeptide (TPR) repeat protein
MLAPDDAGAPAPPERIGPYLVRGELGRGGMGVVYRASHESLHRDVALKVLPTPWTVAPKRVERFLREAAAAARLDHPGIARVFDAGRVDGTFYYAMELVDGRTLRSVSCRVEEACQRDPRRLPDSPQLGVAGCKNRAHEVAAVGVQIARALAHAHAHGVVHLDVKPQNLMLDGDGRIRLLDFGLAKDLAYDVSMSGDYAGTPHYTSPEQVEPGRFPVDARADIFSLGTVLYELATLRRPFEGASGEAVLRAVLNDEPRPLRSFDPRLPRDLEAVVMRALEKRPEARYADASELAEDLARCQRGEPVHARRSAWWRRLSRRVRKNPWATAAVTLAVLLFVGAPVAGLVWSTHENAALARERRVAELGFDRTRRAVDRLMTRVMTDDVPDLPYVQDFRLRLLEDAREFQAELAAEAPGDASVVLELARASSRVGQLRAELGQHAKALEAFTAAIEICRRLDRKGDPDFDLFLACTLADAGFARHALADRAAARELIGEARAIWSKLCSALPSDDPRHELVDRARAIAAVRWADATLFVDPARAEAELDTADQALRGVSVGPHVPARIAQHIRILRADVARARATLTSWLGRTDESAHALDLATAELEAARALGTPGPRLRVLAARLDVARGDLALGAGKLDAAEAAFRTALAARRELVREYSTARGYRAQLADVLELLARCNLFQGRAEPAADLVAEAEALAQELGSDDGDPLGSRLAARCAATRGAVALRTVNDLDEVELVLRRADELFRALLDRTPEDLWVRSELGGVKSNRALVRLRARTDVNEALAFARDACSLQRDALAGAPGHPGFTQYLLNSLSLSAEAALRAREVATADQVLREAVAVAGKRADKLVLFAAGLVLCGDRTEDAAARQQSHDAALAAIARAAEFDPRAVAGLRDDPRFRSIQSALQGAVPEAKR